MTPGAYHWPCDKYRYLEGQLASASERLWSGVNERRIWVKAGQTAKWIKVPGSRSDPGTDLVTSGLAEVNTGAHCPTGPF